MKYKVLRTDTADALIRNIVLYIAEKFGNETALEKLNDLEASILALGDNPYIGTEPRYTVLKRQGYKVLILEKDLVFYKIDDERKVITVYAVVDQRQDYLSIIYQNYIIVCLHVKIRSAGLPVCRFFTGSYLFI